jgi:hypothetical protein
MTITTKGNENASFAFYNNHRPVLCLAFRGSSTRYYKCGESLRPHHHQGANVSIHAEVLLDYHE